MISICFVFQFDMNNSQFGHHTSGFGSQLAAGTPTYTPFQHKGQGFNTSQFQTPGILSDENCFLFK